MPIEFTEEQQAVVDSDSQTLLVSASAGSGKTTVLVERYLRHVLRDGLAPNSICAVTFTYKAATEMRTRIIETLRQRGRFDLMEQAETGPIGTFDSLCERLLRENAIEAGLAPDYKILGSADLAQLSNDSIKVALAAAKRIASEDDEEDLDGLEASLAGRSSYRATQPHSELLRQIGAFVTNFRNGRLSPEELELRFGTPEQVLESWHRDGLRACPVSVIDLPAIEPKVGSPEFWESLKSVLGVAETPKWLGGEPDPVAELTQARYTAQVVRIGCFAWRKLEAAMLARNELDFSFQQRLILHQLAESELVRRRVGTTMRAIMVDEAQDLNPLQFLLLDQLRAALGKNGFVTLVGDSKQSIYGFRQATPQQFDALRDRWTNLSLTKNHRSELGIQCFVDTWSDPAFEGYERMQPDFSTEKPGPNLGVEVEGASGFAPELIAKKVQTLIEQGWKPGQIAVLAESWADLEKVGTALHRVGVRSQGSGSKTRFHTHLTVRDLAATLRALVDPTDDLAYLTVLRSPIADLSLDSIVELAWLGKQARSGESPEAEVDRPLSEIEWLPESEVDTEKYIRFSTWFEPLQKEAGRMPAWQVLSAILAESGYLETMASRYEAAEALANARRLLRMATDKPLLSASEFALQVRQIQELDVRDQDAGVDRDETAVVLSTVHSAKGLEFDAVVIARTPQDKRYDDELEIDLMGERLATGHEKTVHPYLNYLRHEKRRVELAESNRKVYVGLTRAKKRLVVFAANGTIIGKTLVKASGNDAPTALRRPNST